MPNWIPVFTLPNVLVKDPIEVEYVALVSPDDPRCREIGKTNKNFLKFLRSFTDAFKRKVIPSVVIMRDDAPQWVMSMEAVGAFRDAISLSAVVHNRTNSILYSNARSYQYSTFFDFYAWNLSKDFNLLVTNNPALLGMDTIDEFKGRSTAGLPTSKWEGLEVDETLLNALLGEWPRRFSKSPASWRSRALFRSLNMAHAAAQIPVPTALSFPQSPANALAALAGINSTPAVRCEGMPAKLSPYPRTKFSAEFPQTHTR